MFYAILFIVAVAALLGVFIWGMFQPVETEQVLEKKARKEAKKAAKLSATETTEDEF